MAFDWSPLAISLKTASVATVITGYLGTVAAWWLFNYQGKGKAWFDGLFTLSLVLPPTVVGFLLLLLFGKHGPIGQVLQFFGLSIVFSWFATVIAATVVAFPLMYRTTLGAFEQVDAHLIQAARTLGASDWRIFWRVLIPLAWPGMVAGLILAFARSLGEFGATLMLAGNIPGQTQTIPTAIFFAVEQGNRSQALIWVVVVVAIALLTIANLNYWSQHRLWSALHSPGSEQTQLPESLKLDRVRRIKPAVPETKTVPFKPELAIAISKQLSNFSLDVSYAADQKPLGLLGASGSGKSMTLRCIAGLETPTAGHIVLNGRVLFDSKHQINLPSQQRQVGFLFQNYALFPHMTVVENIEFGLHNLSKAERGSRVARHIRMMQLQGLERRYPHQLSGGQQQRVALARALAIEPQILLLDEPFSALDTHLRSQLEKHLREILANYSGVTLFVTHNLEEAYRICQNLVILEAGKAIAHGPKAEIVERPTTFAVAQLTGCKNFSQAERVGTQIIRAVNWHCLLHVVEPIPTGVSMVGIRAHHITFMTAPGQSDREQATNDQNIFPCWLAQTSETPHRMTLYLKLHAAPTDEQDYHLQAEVFKEKWLWLKDQPLPWHVSLDALQLFLMTG
ncbi:MAG: molybdate ABC transporter permease subunit [Trichocoleus desertorum ATA4-8-CV12]|jgi:molybdate transport system permease protein|nr:molybdate ABC transporter permease subunit [Trichocoleus desertorum ATA4-8-CV12]